MSEVEILKEKFVQWREFLNGKNPNSNGIDSNSVSGVMYSLFWEMGAYDAYVAICKNEPNSPLATQLFGKLTAYSYIQVQALRIRRLCEPQINKVNDTKDTSIYSLRRIVDEMKQARKTKLLTRENLLEVYGIFSSKEELQKRYDHELNDGGGNFDPQSMFDIQTHSMLDKICDENGFKKKLFDKLDERLLVDQNLRLDEIIYFVDKNIAHSSSDDSRQQIKHDLRLGLMDMKKVIQDITEVYYCLNWLISRADQAGMVAVGWQNELVNLSDYEKKIVHDAYSKVDAECVVWKRTGYGFIGL